MYATHSEVKVLLKLVCYTCGVTILETMVQYFLPIVLLYLCAFLLTVVGLLCIVLLFCVYLCYLMRIVLLCVYCWLEVSIQKVLQPATTAQVFLGFPVSKSEC